MAFWNARNCWEVPTAKVADGSRGGFWFLHLKIPPKCGVWGLPGCLFLPVKSPCFFLWNHHFLSPPWPSFPRTGAFAATTRTSAGAICDVRVVDCCSSGRAFAVSTAPELEKLRCICQSHENSRFGETNAGKNAWGEIYVLICYMYIMHYIYHAVSFEIYCMER